MDIRQMIGRSTVILDGGMSTALRDHGADLSGPLWTARALTDDPDSVVAAHLDFLRAGARVVITASYQASIEGLGRAGIDADRAELLLRRSVELAAQARARFLDERPAAGTILVAGSIGPYGAMLAGGQEFTGDYGDGIGRAELAAFHEPQIDVLLDAGADLLAAETLPRVDEAGAIVDALRTRPEGRAWLSFTCRDGRTAGGDPIEDAARLADRADQIVAVGVNCTPPDQVAGLLRTIRRATGKPLIAYPNAGGVWDASTRSWAAATRDRFDRDEIRSWVDAGADVVGGCCGIGAAGINAVATSVRG
ncbi:MAG: homocysteine S-methyltransferase [Actinomycetota bacterium]